MVDPSKFSQHVRRLFGERPEVARICEEIAHFVIDGASKRKLHLTLSLLRRHTHPSTDTDLLMAVQYLTGAEADLLEPNYAYLDESGEQLPIANDQIARGAAAAAASLGVSFTSEEEFEAKVLMYFSPTAHVVEVARRAEAV